MNAAALSIFSHIQTGLSAVHHASPNKYSQCRCIHRYVISNTLPMNAAALSIFSHILTGLTAV